MNRQRRALLLAWEAADWNLLHPLLDRGEMPNLAALLSRGVMGSLTAPLPLEPGLLWASLATGRRAAGHGVLGSGRRAGEPPRGTSALGDRNCPAFWDLLHGRGLRTHLVNWPMTGASENTGGACVTDAFFALTRARKTTPVAGLIFSASLAGTLASLRVEPGEIDDATLRFFVPGLDHASREHDGRLSQLARAVARALSIQAATTWLMENRPWDVLAVRFDLLSELASWALPLAAPKLEIVGQLEFDLFQQVMESACRTLDLLLGPLVTMAGEACVILVSERGLPPGGSRPARSATDLKTAARWRQREGMVVVSGPGCRPDEVIRGAGLLDVAPTLLAVLGVPLPPETEGRFLAGAFVEPPEPVVRPVDPPWSIRTEMPAAPFTGDADDETIRRAWNLARSQLDGGQTLAALALLDEIGRARPYHFRFMTTRFECQLALRQVAAARETFERILDRIWGTPQAALYQARLEYAARNYAASLRHLEQIEPAALQLPRLHLQVGLNLVKLSQSARARASFERELEIQPHSAEARAGLAYCCLRAADFEAASAHALEAIALHSQAYYAHFLLGLAQARRGEIDVAIAAFRAAVTLVPDFAPGHRCLAILYGRDPEKKELSRHHKDRAHTARHWAWGF